MKVKCIDAGFSSLVFGKVYTVIGDCYEGEYVLQEGGTWLKSRFEIVEEVEEKSVQPTAIDSHYNFDYRLTMDESAGSVLKIDPYFVANVWKIGAKDNSGVIFHILKTCARFGDKNDKEREIKAIYKSIKRLAELEGVDLA